MIPLRRYSRSLRTAFLLLLIGGAGLWILPAPHALRDPDIQTPLKILDRHGALLYEARDPQGGDSHPLPFKKVPETFIHAILASEDRSFYEHHGVSAKAIARALWQNITAGRRVSGASTITQQLVRIRMGFTKRGYITKLQEAWYATKLERALSKDDILEAYINSAYFGHQAYGLHSAARTYFGKSVGELSLSEAAFLAGLVQSPSAYNPFKYMDRAKTRQKNVLTAMQDAGLLSEEQAKDATSQSIRLAPDRTLIRAPHFVFWVLEQLSEEEKQRSSIRTTLDLHLQQEAERIVSQQMEQLKDKNVTSAAVVVLDAKTSEILAMVGSADYFDEENDGAVNVTVAQRQPGSALKPFTYALALEKGDTAATTVADIETQFFTQEGNPYIPRNYDYGYHGLVRYREALANSYNIAAVRVLEKVGVQNLLSFLQRAGISTLIQTPEHYGIALTLGDGEVKLLELASAYGVFAREGKTMTPRFRLEDRSLEGEKILSAETTWLISNILSDSEARIPEFGEDNPLNFPFPVAAKTGTTRNSRDNWTVGYTPDRIVGVWVGNADNTPMKGTSGVTGAGPVFHDVFLAAQQGKEMSIFRRPENIESLEICRLSGMLPSPLCPKTIREWFVRGTEPKQQDNMHQIVEIDTRNGLRASDDCPETVTEEREMIRFPAELRRWARENNWPVAPERASPLCRSITAMLTIEEETEEIAITKPHDQDSFRLDPLIPDEHEKIILEARAPGISKLQWFVNDKEVAIGSAPDFRASWQPSIGTWMIEVKENGKKVDSIQVRIED
jgi:penicillin-binding protein 1C